MMYNHTLKLQKHSMSILNFGDWWSKLVGQYQSFQHFFLDFAVLILKALHGST